MRLIQVVFIFFLLASAQSEAAQDSTCIENICIGDDLESLSLEWKPVALNYKISRQVENDLSKQTLDELYDDSNEKIITDKTTLRSLVPYIMHLQKFDASVLEKLRKVRAICTPLSLTGEVKHESRTKLFVTFRAVADEGRRGKLRVVQIEKQFDIYPPHIRPEDKNKYIGLLDALRESYPSMILVRDIDAVVESNKVIFANAILGYRFFSDVSSPLVFRLKDTADIESVDDSKQISKECLTAA